MGTEPSAAGVASPCIHPTERATEGPCAVCGLADAEHVGDERHVWRGRVLSVCGHEADRHALGERLGTDPTEVTPGCLDCGSLHAYVPGQECPACERRPFRRTPGQRCAICNDTSAALAHQGLKMNRPTHTFEVPPCDRCGGLGILTAEVERIT
jgi:hypothetical protein